MTVLARGSVVKLVGRKTERVTFATDKRRQGQRGRATRAAGVARSAAGSARWVACQAHAAGCPTAHHVRARLAGIQALRTVQGKHLAVLAHLAHAYKSRGNKAPKKKDEKLEE